MKKVDDSLFHYRIRDVQDVQDESTVRTTRLRVLLLAFVVVAVSITGACAQDGGGVHSSKRPALRVGVSPTYAPVIFESDGEIVGIEADLAHIIGKALGRRIVFVRYPFPELLEALLRGEVDVVMSGLSVTPERAERVRFTEPYMQVGQLALIRSSDIARFGRSHLIRRIGARVGYERGTTGERFVATELTRSINFAFESVDSGIRSLRAGRIDFFVHDAPTVWRLAGDPTSRDLQGLYHPLTDEYLAWAVRPEDTKLLTLLNTTLAHWKRRGLIDTVVARWIPVRVTLR